MPPRVNNDSKTSSSQLSTSYDSPPMYFPVSQPTTPKQTPSATPKETPSATPKETPSATPKETPSATPIIPRSNYGALNSGYGDAEEGVIKAASQSKLADATNVDNVMVERKPVSWRLYWEDLSQDSIVACFFLLFVAMFCQVERNRS